MTAPMLRGTVAAHGFILDVPLIGETEAARRVFERWQPGAELRSLPGGRWLLLLAEPVEIRAERAPGLPVADPSRRDWQNLAIVALTPWLPAKPVRRLRPLDRPAPTPQTPEEPEVVPAPDLRAVARIGARSARQRRLMGEFDGSRTSRWYHRIPALVTVGPGTAAVALTLCVVAIIALIFTVGGSEHSQSGVAVTPTSSAPLPSPTASIDPNPPGFGITNPVDSSPTNSGGFNVHLPIIFLVVLALRLIFGTRVSLVHLGRRLTGTAAGARRPAGRGGRIRSPWLHNLLARLTMRSPAAGFVRGRHLRYLRELTESFERRDYDKALRNAIALDNRSPYRGITRLRLALPKSRTGNLTPTARQRTGGNRPPYGIQVYLHLRQLYQDAAKRLEKDGRVDEAAFIHADLLNLPLEAVSVLERAGRHRQAAELAEGRRLAPELVVRLWWRAGDRQRAIDVALARGAFASAVERLTPIDPDAAAQLRAAWVETLRRGGDHLGAVEAAWPDARLRQASLDDIRTGLAVGGARSARLLAYLAALSAEESRDAVRALFATDNLVHRTEFLTTLAELEPVDPTWDREMATLGIRALVRDAGGTLPAKDAGQLYDTLTKRADPLAAADLRRPPNRPAPPEPGILTVTMPSGRGRLEIADAAGLDDGSIRVAHGESGIRILTSNGRPKAAWDLPTHQLVLADHGANALLVTRRGRIAEIRRLDLATRTITYWTTIEATRIADSYDGNTLIVTDDDGIAVHEVMAAKPRIVFRPLPEPGWQVQRLIRTPTSCTADLLNPQAQPDVWRWELPGWPLRSRGDQTQSPPPGWVAAPVDGDFVLSIDDMAGSGHVMVTFADTAELPTFRLRRQGSRVTLAAGASVIVVERGDLIASV